MIKDQKNSINNQILLFDQKNVHRNLEERHMIIISLSETIETDLFLAFDQASVSAGLGGAFIFVFPLSFILL